jgi:arylsulfatase A-like enzyme
MQSGLQGTTCVPSQAVLLSGRRPFRIDEKLQRDPTWPAAFGNAGYTTFMSGKWHKGPDRSRPAFRSRSIFAGGMTNPIGQEDAFFHLERLLTELLQVRVPLGEPDDRERIGRPNS